MIAVELKELPAQRIARVSGHALGFGSENIGPVLGPMYTTLTERLDAAGVEFGPSALATYEASSDSRVKVDAAFQIGPDVQAGEGFDVVDLSAVDLAATTVHRGSMATIGDTWEAMMSWIDQNGCEPSGLCREIYLVSEPKPQEEWITELQQPVMRAAS
jgi:effector-binding domain-containing protein